MRFVPVNTAHLAYLAEHMREVDRAEVWAASNALPLDVLHESVALTDRAEVMEHNGVPVAVCGVATIPNAPGIGAPWLLGTDEIDRLPVAFNKLCVEWVARQRSRWVVLLNYTDARAVKTHHWLEWLGFTLYPPEPYGVEGKPFRRFEMR